MNHYTSFHTAPKTTIALVNIGQNPTLSNAIKTAVIPAALLDSTLRNVNSQVKPGQIWKELTK